MFTDRSSTTKHPNSRTYRKPIPEKKNIDLPSFKIRKKFSKALPRKESYIFWWNRGHWKIDGNANIYAKGMLLLRAKVCYRNSTLGSVAAGVPPRRGCPQPEECEEMVHGLQRADQEKMKPRSRKGVINNQRMVQMRRQAGRSGKRAEAGQSQGNVRMQSAHTSVNVPGAEHAPPSRLGGRKAGKPLGWSPTQ